MLLSISREAEASVWQIGMKSSVYTTYSDTDMLAFKKAEKMSSEIKIK